MNNQSDFPRLQVQALSDEVLHFVMDMAEEEASGATTREEIQALLLVFWETELLCQEDIDTAQERFDESFDFARELEARRAFMAWGNVRRRFTA